MHVVGVYDGRNLSLYAGGVLAASSPACPAPPCGNITYPPPTAQVPRPARPSRPPLVRPGAGGLGCAGSV